LLVAGGAVVAYAKFGSLASSGNDRDADPATGAGSDAPRDVSGTSSDLAAEPPAPRVEPSGKLEAVPLVEAIGSATAPTTAPQPPPPPRQRPASSRPPKAPPKSEPTAPSPPDKAPVDSKTPVFEENPYRQR
jgi:hypothetical protein